MHMHTADIYTYVRKGYVPPWLPESRRQNVTLMDAMAAQAAICAKGGYEVLVDGIVGPWFLEPWLGAARSHGIDLRYVPLLPDLGQALARGTARTAPGAMTDPAVIEQMWRQFRGSAVAEGHVVDTTGHTADDTVAAVAAGLAAGAFKLA
jgi:hypothetical protein